jgi:cell division protein FtsI (penicillin-binding protein 3)
MTVERRRTVRPCQPHAGERAGGLRDWLRVNGERKSLLETGRTRLLVTGLVFACAFAVLGLRVLDVAVLRGAPQAAIADTERDRPDAKQRADIVDRQGRLLATSLPAPSLYANPTEVARPERAAAKLAGILPELSQARAARRMAMDREFIWLKRGLTPRQQARINRLGIPGLYFRTESKRVYPQGKLTAHLVGFTDPDGNGIAGIEKSFDDLLTSARRPLQLSIDLRLQHILADELSRSMQEFRAKGGSGILMDARTGELLAMASLPSFDPATPGGADDEARFNRATLGVYEMGSVFKVFTMAGALDRGVVELSDRFNVDDPIRAAGYTIRDFKPKDGKLTVPEIFMHSSNIGTARIAREMGTKTQRSVLRQLGLTRPVQVELPELGNPIVPSPWRPINTLTVSYGHGLAVTPLQLTTAVAATVNGGLRRKPTLLARQDATRTPGQRVLSADTSRTMRRLMRLVVEHGTGGKADARGYRVGGKTGTADKLANGRYSTDANIASFVGAFPMDEPRYVIFAMLDEPKGHEGTYGHATGGWVAAPLVRRVVARTAGVLNVPPRPPANTPDKANHPLLLEARANGEDGNVAAH